MGKLMLNDRCYTGSENILMLNDEGYSGGQLSHISYLKWKITDTRSNPSANALQLSEFYLYLNGELYNWNSNVSITASLSPVSASESIEKIIDGDIDTKYTTTQWGVSYVGQCEIVISLGETITINNNTTYAYATANDEPSRDPTGWALWGSSDGSNWFVLDARDDASVPTERKTSTQKFNINIGSMEYYPESWIINSQTSIPIPTTTTHIQYTDGVISAFDVCQNQGDATITMGDITTFIGSASSWLWRVTANNDMTYRLYDVLTGTLGELQTAQSGDVIIDDGITGTAYCVEIRRYS